MRNEYQAFQDVGAEVVALAVASASTVDANVRRGIEPPYPLLGDPDHKAAEAFNVYNLLGNGLAAPSVFIIDTDGAIVWSYVGESSRDRPATSTILEHVP